MMKNATSQKAASRRKAPVRLRWLGQAGFEITAPGGETCLVDPYLSNWCGDNTGSYRIVPSPLDPEKVRPGVVVNTHWHEDHLDPEAIPIIGRASPDTVFVGPPSSMARCRRWRIADKRLLPLLLGETVEVGPFRITAGYARHEVPGFLTEDAVSLLIEVAGRRIYHSGDTVYDERILTAIDLKGIDAGLFVINGSGGNMNLREAAFLAAEIGCRISIPMHYGMWAKDTYGPAATLDPAEFVRRVATYGGRKARALAHGGAVEIP